MAFGTGFVAPKGSTGNNTHPGVEVPGTFEALAFNFIVEAVGATPTVTYKFQVSMDDPIIPDASATWTDMPYIAGWPTTETPANATQVVTGVGTTTSFFHMGVGNKFMRRVRLVTSANTNVTYRAEIVVKDSEN